MGLTGTIDASVYTGLRDVLSRHPKITTVGFEPDSISKEYIRASIAPDRIEPHYSKWSGGFDERRNPIESTTRTQTRASTVGGTATRIIRTPVRYTFSTNTEAQGNPIGYAQNSRNLFRQKFCGLRFIGCSKRRYQHIRRLDSRFS